VAGHAVCIASNRVPLDGVLAGRKFALKWGDQLRAVSRIDRSITAYRMTFIVVDFNARETSFQSFAKADANICWAYCDCRIGFGVSAFQQRMRKRSTRRNR